MSSTSIMPDQADALCRLFRDTNALILEVQASEHSSLDVMTFTRLAERGEDDAAVRVRFFNVSVAGTVRERDAETEQVAA